jgi:hypothetical protein
MLQQQLGRRRQLLLADYPAHHPVLLRRLGRQWLRERLRLRKQQLRL